MEQHAQAESGKHGIKNLRATAGVLVEQYHEAYHMGSDVEWR